MEKSFSLIELLIVVTIIGALATVIVFSITGSTEGIQHNIIKNDIKGIITPLKQFSFQTAGQTPGIDYSHVCDANSPTLQLREKYDQSKSSSVAFKENVEKAYGCESDRRSYVIAVAVKETITEQGDSINKEQMTVYCIDSKFPSIKVNPDQGLAKNDNRKNNSRSVAAINELIENPNIVENGLCKR